MTSLRERIGELFMIGYPGTDPSAASDLIQRHHVGGIILFTRNIRNAAHAREVCLHLQELRARVSDMPLFIAIDQEGGCVARITEGVTIFPGNMALGATGSEEFARQAGRVTARELAALGITVNFAPVLDISTLPRNPGVGARSFGSDPAMVSRLASAMISGLQENGLCAAAKHFPGLGEARIDSHDDLPVVDHPRARIEKVELAPFRAAVKAGVAFVMTAHCSFPALDETGAPATLSAPLLKDLLRGRMKYEGVVITDCLEMGAVEKRYEAPQSARLAFHAGADMLLICHTREKQVAAIDSLARSAETGEIDEERIDQSSARIRSIKENLKNIPAESAYTPQTKLSEEIAARAVTLVQNENNFVPLRLRHSDRLVVVTPRFEVLTKVEDAAQHNKGFLNEVKRFHQNLTHLEISVRPDAGEIRRTIEKCANADVLIILTYNLHLNPPQRECVQALLDLGRPAVVAAVRDPHDLAFISGAEATIATYSFRKCSLKALAGVLFGKIKAEGSLPIRLQ
ncbi:MAG: beta-N-acetylhexosaminidase [Candidatus Abyssobacteria bacterium SURF_5]|uniref:beta-N-acetylhexosaminidase n=1 Tax=Abyssobacteria bacterium (strain SURF_5) TaxID=2093360 RepID=A0A3A4NGU0_ABYX5|nr:MAG: beta-N-acetylhexosaminidase [Candidatus Abyssubacteria bacterium SURF_5]